MTIIEPTPTPTEPPSGRRRAIILAAAAAAVVLVVGAVALGACDDDTEPVTNQPPPATDVAEDPVNATAADVAQGFVEAYGGFEADRAISYLADDAEITGLIAGFNIEDAEGTLDEFRLSLAWLEAIRHSQIMDSCAERGTSAAGIALRRSYDFHSFGSDQLGLGPFRGSHFDLTVRDGEIVRARQAIEISEFSPQLWEPFTAWMDANHPADADVMYARTTHGTRNAPRFTEESIQLWEQHIQQYVDTQAAGPG